jgi:hypothetical protein
MSRRATAAGEKRKGPYQHFAWRDAISLASLLMDTFEPRRMLELFRSFDYVQLRDLEKRWRIEVAELIEKTERPAELRRLAREHPAEQAAELVLLFAIMGQVRTCRILEMRDRYRTAISDGADSLLECADWYEMSCHIAEQFDSYEFPFEVFAACEARIDWGESEPSDESQ